MWACSLFRSFKNTFKSLLKYLKKTKDKIFSTLNNRSICSSLLNIKTVGKWSEEIINKQSSMLICWHVWYYYRDISFIKDWLWKKNKIEVFQSIYPLITVLSIKYLLLNINSLELIYNIAWNNVISLYRLVSYLSHVGIKHPNMNRNICLIWLPVNPKMIQFFPVVFLF